MFGRICDKGGLRQKLSPDFSPFVHLWNSLEKFCRYTWLVSKEIKVLIKIFRQDGLCALGTVRILPLCLPHKMMNTLTVSLPTFSPVFCTVGINEYLLNEWMCKWMNVPWRTNPGVVIIACFLLIPIFDFTVLSQEKASLSSLRNYRRVELIKNM